MRRLSASLPWVGMLIASGGIVLAVSAVRALGVARFFGRPVEAPRLILRGPYRFVRHPFYLGVLMLLFGLLFATRAPVITVAFIATAAATPIVIAIEDHTLGGRFGEAYRRYREAVPRLIPLRRKSGR